MSYRRYSKSLSYTVLRTAVLSSTDFSKVPKSFVLHENLEQCEFLYIWIWVTRFFVLSNTILRVILSWIQMFWAARFLSYTDFPLSQKSCSSRSYCTYFLKKYFSLANTIKSKNSLFFYPYINIIWNAITIKSQIW